MTCQVQVWAVGVLAAVLSANIVITSALPEPEMAGCKNRVIIIGAGVSGIGAASKLMQNGISDIVVLEAMDRIGGRVNYNKIGTGEYGGVDLGGHWVHGQGGNIIYELAEPLGLVHHSGDFNNASFFRTDGSELKLDPELFQEMMATVGDDIEDPEEAGKDSITFVQYIKERLAKFAESNNLTDKDGAAIRQLSEKMLCLLDSTSNLSLLSLKTAGEFDDCEGDRLIEWKSGGMGNIIHILTGKHEKSPWHGLGVEDKVKLSSRVARVNWSNSSEGNRGNKCVSVTTESGDIFTADYVIFTPSLNVLKKNHKNIFNPPLPQDKVDVIQALGMDVVDKIYLVFKESWWPENLDVFHLLHEKQYPNETSDWGDDIVSIAGEHHNPHILAFWMVGESAKQMELCDDKQVTDTCMRIMRQYLGKQYNIPDPVTMIRSRWWNNKDVGGSYSYNSVVAENMDKPRHILARPLTNDNGKTVVLFAGEATNPTRFSTVHGALETGWREADRIIQMTNTKS